MLTFTFHSFKPFAHKLLQEQLPQLAHTYYQLVKEVSLPILSSYSNLSQEQAIKMAEASLHNFLQSVLEDKALEQELAAIERWYHNQNETYSRERIKAADLLLIYSVRRKLFIQFLPCYTSDIQKGLDVLKEYEEFSTIAGKRAFDVWEQIRQEELKKERLQREDALREKGMELQTQKDELQLMVQALQTSNLELENTRQQLQSFNTELEKRVSERTNDLEYQRQWLYNLFMQVPGLIGILSGEEGTVVLFNEAFSRLWGGRQVLGMSMEQALPELEGPEFFKSVADVMQTGKAVELREYPASVDRFNDGRLQQAYFNFVYLPYLNPDGENEGVIIYGVDVTEQVEARQKVEQSKEQLRLALEAGQMGIWEYDPINNTSDHSPIFNKIFGYAEKEEGWNYERFMSHIPADQREAIAETYAQALLTGNLFYETRILAANEVYRWISIKGKVFYDANRQPIRIVGAIMDISERKKAEEDLQLSHQELKRINTDLDNFIYTASHDLRSPIINLESLLILLLKMQQHQAEGEEKKVLNMMSTSIGRLKRTIDALTDITRIQKEDELWEKVEIIEVLHEVEADLVPELAEAKGRFIIDLEVPTIHFVPHNLRSILFNLLSNALKYRKPDVPVIINLSTYKEEEYTVLCVQDNGLGISEANQRKLFSMFKRFHTHVKGSGIGLYLLKRIIENAGGYIEASSAEGVGSTFRVYFPNKEA